MNSELLLGKCLLIYFYILTKKNTIFIPATPFIIPHNILNVKVKFNVVILAYKRWKFDFSIIIPCKKYPA